MTNCKGCIRMFKYYYSIFLEGLRQNTGGVLKITGIRAKNRTRNPLNTDHSTAMSRTNLLGGGDRVY